MRRLILLERPPDVWELHPEDQVVSLTPQASYWLDKNKKLYGIPSDFGVEERLKEREDSYWQGELAWFNEVDALLQERLPELKAGNIFPAILYGYHLKALLDHLFIRSVEIGTLLEGGFDRVVLWPSDPPVAPRRRFLEICLDYRGVYSRLLSHWCAERGILYQEMSPPVPTVLAGLRAAFPTQWKGRLKEWRWRVDGILSGSGSPRRRLTLLFLETGDYLGVLLKEALKKGHRCFISDGKDRLLDLSDPGRSCRGFGSTDPLEEANVRWAQGAEDLFGLESRLWNWPDSWFGVPMAPLLCDPLKQWVQQDLTQLIRSSNRLKTIYLRERVDFVLAPFLITPLDFAAVAACDGSVPTQSVLMADGDGPDEAKVWDLTEISRTQHYFVPSTEFSEYFRCRTPARRPAAQIHVGSDRWQRYTLLADPRLSRHRAGESSRPVVVYVASRRERDIRYLNKTEYPETWYYRLQCALLETFADLPGYTFVVKLFPTPDQGPSVVAAKVRDLERSHILVSRSPFRRWLARADRVILDAPSTTLYETALAGVPFHLLVHRKAAIRSTGLSFLDSCATFFEDPQEAAFAVKRYLSSPSVGAPSISPEGLPVLTTLETLG